MGRFEELIDHERHRVSYVVDAVGARGVLAPPERIASTVQIEDVNDFEALRDAVSRVADEVGPVDRLIAVSEFTLGIAAEVREALDIPGPRPEDVAVYRNKLRMKELVAKAGVRVPRFAPAESGLDFARATGFPDPEAGGRGRQHGCAPRRRRSRAHHAAVPGRRRRLRARGIRRRHDLPRRRVRRRGRRIPFMAVSRYINDCLAFEAGRQPLGSVVVQDSPLRTRVHEFARRCVSGLGMTNMPFHLELFVTPDGDLVFLEIAGRIGGAEVPYLLDKVFGVNLFELWLDALCEGGARVPRQTGDPSGGWLIIPKPAGLPPRSSR